MSNENQLCKESILSADWDRAIAALPAKDEDLSKEDFTSEDFSNRAYARCFQANKDHQDGKYDDVIADASKALAKGGQNNRALCIRAYGYYLNNNYEAAIKDCERIVAGCDVEAEKKDACDKRKAAVDEKQKSDEEKAEAVEKTNASDKDTLKQPADDAAVKAQTAIEAAEAAQKVYCEALHPAAFAHELLGLIYTSMGLPLEASRNYEKALLYRQTNIESASPLLMDAYRNARALIKSI